MHDDQTNENKRTADAWIKSFERVVNDAEARRELIWLRAAEKGDRETIEALEREDPDIPRRLEPLAHATWEAAGWPDVRDPRVRRELYQIMYDARLCHHMARMSGRDPNAFECMCDWPRA
jgi:hypothetical protein